MADAQGLHNDSFDDIGGDEYSYGGAVVEAPPMVTGADYDLSNITGYGQEHDSCHWHMFGVIALGIGLIALLYKGGVRGIAAA